MENQVEEKIKTLDQSIATKEEKVEDEEINLQRRYLDPTSSNFWAWIFKRSYMRLLGVLIGTVIILLIALIGILISK